MKNGEAERPNAGSLDCDQSCGDVTFLCLQPASAGTDHFWEVVLSSRGSPPQGPPLWAHTGRIFQAVQRKSWPSPTGSEFSWSPLKVLLWKCLWMTLHAEFSAFFLWQSWGKAFGACSARKCGSIHVQKASTGLIFWKLELKTKCILKLAMRKIKVLSYLSNTCYSAEEEREFSALCCHIDQIWVSLRGHFSLLPSHHRAGHKTFYRNRGT